MPRVCLDRPDFDDLVGDDACGIDAARRVQVEAEPELAGHAHVAVDAGRHRHVLLPREVGDPCALAGHDQCVHDEAPQRAEVDPVLVLLRLPRRQERPALALARRRNQERKVGRFLVCVCRIDGVLERMGVV